MCLETVNVVQLVGLVVAIVAGFLAVVGWYINNHMSERLRKVEGQAKEMKADAFYLGCIAENTVKVFLRVDETTKKMQVLLGRLMTERKLSGSAYRAYMRSEGEARRGTQKIIQTLCIYSSKRELRQSALKQLSEDLGGADTLRALVELQKHEKDLQDDLSRAILDLQARLDEPRTSSQSSAPVS